VSAAPRPTRAVPSTSPSTRSTASGTEAWRQLAARGENTQAYSILGQEGIASESRAASVDDLFALADVARLSGHPRDAVPPLESILERYPSDPRAALAALTLGRVQLRSLALPSQASASLRRAFALGVPSALAEDAYALLIEACARSGDKAGARLAYEQYAARFPDAARRAELRTWVERP
jgi:transmembrane sensor